MEIVKLTTIQKNDFLEQHQNMFLLFKMRMVSYHTIFASNKLDFR